MKDFLLVLILIVSAAMYARTAVTQDSVTQHSDKRVDSSGYPHADANALAHTPLVRHAELRLATGVRLHYVEQGNANGPTVILLHGYSDSWVSYTRVLPLLDKKYHVYVPDLRGHGESERPASGYTLPDFAGDIVAFMDAKSIRKATIVGHSMGSFVAQHVAIMAPERVERLVLVGSAPAVSNGEVSQLQIEVNALTDPVPPKFVTEFQKSVITRPVPDEFMDRVIQESLKLPARVWRDAMAGMLTQNSSVTLGKIKAPTLIIWGDQETVFPKRSDQEVLRKAIPKAELKVYEGTGHCPNWEEPARFVKDLQEFVEGK